jgi:hypothetical protein
MNNFARQYNKNSATRAFSLRARFAEFKQQATI